MYSEKLDMLIDGRWRQGGEGKSQAVINPATEEVIAQVPHASQHDFDMVDVFQFTVGKDGFSNDLFHVDRVHLGAKALPEIEQQLS